MRSDLPVPGGLATALLTKVPSLAVDLAASEEDVSLTDEESVLAVVADVLCSGFESHQVTLEILSALEELAAGADDEVAQLIGLCLLGSLPPPVLEHLGVHMGPALESLAEDLEQGRLDSDSDLYLEPFGQSGA